MMRESHSLIGLALLLCTVPAASFGDEPTDLGVVTVIGTRTERQPGDVAGTVTVIDSGRIDDELAHDLAGLFRYEPGIGVGRDPGRFGIGDVSIRGVGGNRVAMEVDGVRLPQGFSIGSFAAAGRDYVDPELLKRVEILRGPASTLYGSDALGGVITYTTKDPEDILRGRSRGSAFKSGYNGDDESWQATVSGAVRFSTVSALAAYSRREGDQRDAAAAAANPASYTDGQWLAKLVFADEGHGETRLSFGHTENTATTDVRSLVGGPGKFATTTALDADDRRSRDTWNLGHEMALASVLADSLSIRGYYQSAETRQNSFQQRSAGGREPNPTLRYRNFDYEERVDGAAVVLQKTLTASGIEHGLLYGAELQRQRIEERRDGLQTDLVTGAVTTTVTGESLPVRDFPDSTTLRAGLFVQDEMQTAHPQLVLIPGARFEFTDLDADPDRLFLEDNPGIRVADSSEYSISPKLGGLYRLSENWTAFAQYARGFRAPPAEDVNIGFTIPAFDFIAIPNPDLDPERSHGVELGLRAVGAASSVSLCGFFNRYEDLIESRVNLGVDPETGLLTFQSQNRERATIWGTEARARAELGRWWPAVSGVALKASFAYARGDDDKRNEPLQTVEPATAVLGFVYTARGGRLEFETAATFVARQDRVDNSNIDAFKAPGFAVYDIFARYDLGSRVRLRAGIFNLTDKTYWQWSDVSRLPADYYALDLYTAPGRFFSASFSIVL